MKQKRREKSSAFPKKHSPFGRKKTPAINGHNRIKSSMKIRSNYSKPLEKSNLPSRIEGQAGLESSSMVDDFCKDLYDFLGDKKDSEKGSFLYLFYKFKYNI